MQKILSNNLNNDTQDSTTFINGHGINNNGIKSMQDLNDQNKYIYSNNFKVKKIMCFI